MEAREFETKIRGSDLVCADMWIRARSLVCVGFPWRPHPNTPHPADWRYPLSPRHFGLRLVVLLSGLALNTALILQQEHRHLGVDAPINLQLAENFTNLSSLLAQGGVDSLNYPIAYSLMLGSLDVDFNQGFLLARFAQLILLFVAALSITAIVDTVDVASGTVALGLTLFSTSLISAVHTIGYEILLTALLSLSTLFVWRGHRVWHWLFAGVLLGFAFVVHSKVLVVILVIVVIAGYRRRRALPSIALGVIVAPVLLALRNQISFGQFTPFTRNAYVNLWLGNKPEQGGQYLINSDADFEPSWSLLELLSAIRNNAAASELLALYREKFGTVVSPNPYPVSAELANSLGWFGIDALSMLQWTFSLAGLLIFVTFISALALRSPGGWSRLAPLALIGITGVATALPFVIEPRMRIPYEPFFIACISYSLVQIWRLWKPSQLATGKAVA